MTFSCVNPSCVGLGVYIVFSIGSPNAGAERVKALTFLQGKCEPVDSVFTRCVFHFMMRVSDDMQLVEERAEFDGQHEASPDHDPDLCCSKVPKTLS